MGKRVIVGALLGGAALFFWGFLSHAVLGLGDVGMKGMPSEPAVIEAMRANVPEPGLYFFPWVDHGADEAAMKEWEEKYRQGPHGLLVYDSRGSEMMSPAQLGTQLATDIVLALLVSLVMCHVSGGRGLRIGLVTLMGLIAAFAINVPYWNWYGFPPTFTLGQVADAALGFACLGVVLAFVVKPRNAAVPAM